MAEGPPFLPSHGESNGQSRSSHVTCRWAPDLADSKINILFCNWSVSVTSLLLRIGNGTPTLGGCYLSIVSMNSAEISPEDPKLRRGDAQRIIWTAYFFPRKLARFSGPKLQLESCEGELKINIKFNWKIDLLTPLCQSDVHLAHTQASQPWPRRKRGSCSGGAAQAIGIQAAASWASLFWERGEALLQTALPDKMNDHQNAVSKFKNMDEKKY